MENIGVQARLEQKLAHYGPSAATVELLRTTPTLLLVGISGAGKGTIKDELLKTGKYRYVVSYTTRAPRSNNGVMEQEGREYHFITLEQAEGLIDQGAYVEAKRFGGNVYGSTVMEFQAAHDVGKVAVADIEVQGVAEYMTINPKTIAAYIVPPNFNVWQERFLRRYGGTHDPDEIHGRMRIARNELQHALATSYYTFVMNDQLDGAVNAVEKIVAGEIDLAAAQVAREVAAGLAQDLDMALQAA